MPDFNDLTEADITQAELLLVQAMQDEFPSMDLSQGRVLRDLLIRPAAMFHALNDENMNQLRQSMSILKISQSPTLATDDIVDGVLSNLLITRDDGAAATGKLRIIIKSKLVTTVDSDTLFTANGLNFKPTFAFIGVTTASNVVTTSSRLITARADGNYEFLVDVQAEKVGTEYNMAEGTRFTSVPSITGVVDIIAATDFAGGKTSEDNATLANKAQLGLSPRVLSGRTHIESMLTDNYSTIVDTSIIGYGDVEMLRDAHNLFGIGQGGKVDIYVQTEQIPQRSLIEVTATMLDSATTTLTATLDRETMAGVYDVLAVYRKGDTPFVLQGESDPTLLDSLTISSKTWTHNVTQTGDEFVPDIASSSEAAFTRYRQMVLQFVDQQSTLENGKTATYQVYLLKMPLIASIQDFVNSRSRRNPAADYLIRAPIPVICSIGLEVAARNTSEVDVSAIENAVASRINGLGFSVGHLPGSKIIDAAQGQLPVDAVLDLPITMTGTVYLPDGTVKVISGTDELRIASSLGDATVTARTAIFSVRTGDVDVSVREIVTPET